MSNYKVYHNPRCSKSRMAIQYLNEQNATYEVVEYLKELPSAKELKDILSKLGMKAEALIRKGEPDFKENFKGKELSENEWVAAMITYPQIIERPIVILGDKAIVARPTERIGELG